MRTRTLWIKVWPRLGVVAALGSFAVACGSDGTPQPVDPDTAPKVVVDRFSDDAGMLFRRSADSSLPAADAPIDMDQGPFITQGLGPDGQVVRYYNFDVQPIHPIPIFVFFKDGASTPLAGQLNVIDAIPGGAGYNDFWQVTKGTVPADYVANTVTSAAEIVAGNYPIESLDEIENCPIVPEGSTATLRGGANESTGLHRGWYRGQVASYFGFEEASLAGTGNGEVPLSPIFVTFNDNGVPASGFVTEPNSMQTHNVTGTVPGDAGYSPLWDVQVYDNADFDAVADLQSAANATILAPSAATVNCPLVSVTL